MESSGLRTQDSSTRWRFVLRGSFEKGFEVPDLENQKASFWFFADQLGCLMDSLGSIHPYSMALYGLINIALNLL